MARRAARARRLRAADARRRGGARPAGVGLARRPGALPRLQPLLRRGLLSMGEGGGWDCCLAFVATTPTFPFTDDFTPTAEPRA
eukprot:3412508-Prymnesium_polylepis.1